MIIIFIFIAIYYYINTISVKEEIQDSFSSYFTLIATIFLGIFNAALLYYIYYNQSKMTKEVMEFQLDRQGIFEKEKIKRQLMWESYIVFNNTLKAENIYLHYLSFYVNMPLIREIDYLKKNISNIKNKGDDIEDLIVKSLEKINEYLDIFEEKDYLLKNSLNAFVWENGLLFDIDSEAFLNVYSTSTLLPRYRSFAESNIVYTQDLRVKIDVYKTDFNKLEKELDIVTIDYIAKFLNNYSKFITNIRRQIIQ